jgi:hypothetical protein
MKCPECGSEDIDPPTMPGGSYQCRYCLCRFDEEDG